MLVIKQEKRSPRDKERGVFDLEKQTSLARERMRHAPDLERESETMHVGELGSAGACLFSFLGFLSVFSHFTHLSDYIRNVCARINQHTLPGRRD